MIQLGICLALLPVTGVTVKPRGPLQHKTTYVPYRCDPTVTYESAFTSTASDSSLSVPQIQVPLIPNQLYKTDSLGPSDPAPPRDFHQAHSYAAGRVEARGITVRLQPNAMYDSSSEPNPCSPGHVGHAIPVDPALRTVLATPSPPGASVALQPVTQY